MSGARTIEVQDDRPSGGALLVRLRDGDQVLATSEFFREDGVTSYVEDRQVWDAACRHMRYHNAQFDAGHALAVEDAFNAAIRVLFPEFGTVPDGVET